MLRGPDGKAIGTQTLSDLWEQVAAQVALGESDTSRKIEEAMKDVPPPPH